MHTLHYTYTIICGTHILHVVCKAHPTVLYLILQAKLNTGVEELLSLASAFLLLLIRVLVLLLALGNIVLVGQDEVCMCVCVCVCVCVSMCTNVQNYICNHMYSENIDTRERERDEVDICTCTHALSSERGCNCIHHLKLQSAHLSPDKVSVPKQRCGPHLHQTH